jgi:hypothetical protein
VLAVSWHEVRRCVSCGSSRLRVRVHHPERGSFLRRECVECGSTGPFELVSAGPAADARAELERRRELEHGD